LLKNYQSVNRRRNNVIFLLCFQAMAVAIICFGSLINFHQYKIWGKPLIPNFVGYKRDVEKISKTLSFSKISCDNQRTNRDYQGGDFDFPIDIPRLQYRPESVIFVSLFESKPVSNRVSPVGLRGPPIS
jgi:hypothetical protein